MGNKIEVGSPVYVNRKPTNDTGHYTEVEGRIYYVTEVDLHGMKEYTYCVAEDVVETDDNYIGWFSKEELTLAEDKSALDKVIVVNPTPKSKIPEFPVEGFDIEKNTNKEDYLRFHEECCKKLVEITRKKNSDYTGSSDDPFANFKIVESCNIVSTEKGFLTRMMDKIARINSFVDNGTLLVQDESVEDTLLDLANYSILMAGYIKQKKNA